MFFTWKQLHSLRKLFVGVCSGCDWSEFLLGYRFFRQSFENRSNNTIVMTVRYPHIEMPVVIYISSGPLPDKPPLMVNTLPEPTAPPPSVPGNVLLRPMPGDGNPEQEFDGEVPFEFLCPITNKIMKDPVTASDGYNYERQAIRRWFRRKRTSPVSNEELTDLTFRANEELRNRIRVFMGEHSSVDN